MRRASTPLILFLSLSWACTGAVREDYPHGTTAGRGGDGGTSNDDNGQAGNSGGAPAAACGSKSSWSPTQWRRLTRSQYRNTIKDLLGIDASTDNFLSDSKTGVFATNTLPPQANDVGAYQSSAEALARTAAADPTKLLGCDPSGSAEATCIGGFIKSFGARAYRRELTKAEIDGLTETYNLAKADGPSEGLRLVLEVILQSPSFLYLTEFGVASGNDVILRPEEVATRLSYLLWNSMPDAKLLAAVKSGDLDASSASTVQAQAERMMKDSKFSDTLAEFHKQLFHLDRLEGNLVQKLGAADFDAPMRLAMLDDASAFVKYAVTNQQATVKTLFTAPWAFPSGPLLSVYKLSPADMANGRFTVKEGTRSGLLTSPAFMAAEPPTSTPYGVVQRGKMIRTMLLCDQLPPPPPQLKFTTPPDAATTPQRALLEQHKNDPSCAGCHTLMDPIGLAFESFDTMGRYRETYPKGEKIDPSGEILGDTDVDGPFKSSQELAQKLATSQQVRACLGKHWFRYAYGREPTEEDACTLETFASALGKGDGDLPASLLAFVATDAFRFRKGINK